MRRLVAAALTVGAILSAALTSGAAEDCFRSLTNQERRAVGRAELRQDGRLDVLAEMQSAAMQARGTIFHNRDLAAQAPDFAAVGENVGMGPSCEAIHDAFMASPGHRANILDGDYTHLGVGVKIDPDGTWYVTEVFFRPARERTPTPSPPAARRTPRPRCTCPS